MIKGGTAGHERCISWMRRMHQREEANGYEGLEQVFTGTGASVCRDESNWFSEFHYSKKIFAL